jgi:FixJ family two-component response regulator
MERLVKSFVHVVDDDALFRSVVTPRLTRAGYEVAAYSSAQDFLDRLPSEDRPSCILLDVRFGLTGLKLQSQLRERASTLPVIFLTASINLSLTVKAVKAGAHNFLSKAASLDELLEAIKAAIADHAAICGRRSKLAALTPRQRQVFALVVRGRRNWQIASAIGCTERTVKAHRHDVMEKMQVQTLAELVSVAERIGALPSGLEGLDRSSWAKEVPWRADDVPSSPPSSGRRHPETLGNRH